MKMDVYYMAVNQSQHLQKVKEHYQNKKEEMQEKGQIKIAKLKDKQPEKVENDLTKEGKTLLKSCIYKAYLAKKK